MPYAHTYGIGGKKGWLWVKSGWLTDYLKPGRELHHICDVLQRETARAHRARRFVSHTIYVNIMHANTLTQRLHSLDTQAQTHAHL